MCKLCCSPVSVSLCTADLAADVKRSRDFCRHGRDPAVSKSVSSAVVARTDGGNAEMKAEKTRHENKGITQKTECAVKPNPPMLNKFRRAPAALKLVAENREGTEMLQMQARGSSCGEYSSQRYAWKCLKNMAAGGEGNREPCTPVGVDM